MIPSHHPDDSWLLSYAAGSLDLGQHLAIATHIQGCARCRAWARTLECVGGAGLEDAAPADLSDDALERALPRLDHPMPYTPPRAAVADAPEGLPPFARSFALSPWRKLGASIRTRAILLPEVSATRVLLLESKPGASVFAHTHGALEMTCVLSGAFRHAGGRFAAGDFDCAESDDHHEPEIEDGETCLCLVAIQGDLRWRGFLGRLLQPFIRL
jgi:putative transcriptional regulator